MIHDLYFVLHIVIYNALYSLVQDQNYWGSLTSLLTVALHEVIYIYIYIYIVQVWLILMPCQPIWGVFYAKRLGNCMHCKFPFFFKYNQFANKSIWPINETLIGNYYSAVPLHCLYFQTPQRWGLNHQIHFRVQPFRKG